MFLPYTCIPLILDSLPPACVVQSTLRLFSVDVIPIVVLILFILKVVTPVELTHEGCKTCYLVCYSNINFVSVDIFKMCTNKIINIHIYKSIIIVP